MHSVRIAGLAFGYFVLCGEMGAALKWDSTEVTREIRLEENSVDLVFVFTNEGPGAVRLLEIEPECGCTTAALPKRDYAAGETGRLIARFTPGGRRGLQQKKIFVTTDEDGRKRTALTLKVMIPAAVNFDPRPLVWNREEELSRKVVHIRTTPGVSIGLKPRAAGRLQGVESSLEIIGDGRYELQVTPPTNVRPSGVLLLTFTGEKNGLPIAVDPLPVVFK